MAMRLSSRPLPGASKSAVQVLKTTGLWGSEDVLNTTASDEPAVQVLRTTGLPVDGNEAVFKTNAGGKSAVQVLNTTGLRGSEAVLDTTASDESAVQVLKTTGLPVGGKRLSSRPLPGGESAVQVLKPRDFRLVARGCHQYHGQRQACCSGPQNHLTSGLWQEVIVNTTAGGDGLQISSRAHRSSSLLSSLS